MPPAEDPSVRSLFSFLGLKKAAGPEKPESSDPKTDISADIVDHARAFQSLRVSDLMIPRVDIVAVEESATLAELVRICVDSEHSRLPIYRETLDDPKGVVHIKDVLKLLSPAASGAAKPDWDAPVLHRITREVLFVPTFMTAQDLLVSMQARRIHLALVIDEFGGTSGLVTLEDLLEAVVGEIDDEYDIELVDPIQQVGDHLEIDGRIEIPVLEDRLGARLYPKDEEEEMDTLAGLVSFLAGHVPQRGEVIPCPDAGYDFEVIDADARRVKRLRLHVREQIPVRPELDPSPADD